MKAPFLSLAALSLTLLLYADGPAFRAGIAEVDITPEGKVFDPLMAKALIFRQGDTAAALVVCDIIGVNAERSTKARKLASAKTGIPFENITVAATHTHSGHARADLEDRIAEAVARANAAVAPASLAGAVAEQRTQVSFNRRFLLKDGTVRFNPGLDDKGRPFDGGFPFQLAEIVRPVGPIDPLIHFVLLRSESGQIVGSLSSFSLHACTCPHQQSSADYPHFYEESLQREFGSGFISLFGAGACGDINHTDVSKPGPQMGWEETSKPIGESLAQTVRAATKDLSNERGSLAVRRAVVNVPLQKYTAMDLEWAKHATETKFAGFEGTGYGERSFLAGIRAHKIIELADRRKKFGDAWPLEVHAFRLSSDTAVVTLPGELFVELGLAIQKASPFRNTFVLELANESVYYVPTEKAFAEGSYEVVNSLLAPGGGEMLADAAVKLLRELQ